MGSGQPTGSSHTHSFFLLLWNIQHSSLHRSDSCVSPGGLMGNDHSSWTPPYFPSGVGKTLSRETDSCWASQGKGRGIIEGGRGKRSRNETRKREGILLSSNVCLEDVAHWFLHKDRTSSNNCLFWGHGSKWHEAPSTTHHQVSLKRTRKAPRPFILPLHLVPISAVINLIRLVKSRKWASNRT